jgi:hypothetical protein
MTVSKKDRVISLSGNCPAEDAEILLEYLIAGADRVDLNDCEHLHAAVLQLLMAARPGVSGVPAPFLGQWILPLLTNGEPPPAP